MRVHELAEQRSLALHRLVAERLRADPSTLGMARDRVARWLTDGSTHPAYARAWADLLGGPFDRLLEALTDPGERASDLRQCSPFAGVIDSRTRWRVLREVRERMKRAP